MFGDSSVSQALAGNVASPNAMLYSKFKQVAKMLGTFAAGHHLSGQRRLIVLKIREYLSRWTTINYSQVASCCSDEPEHAPLASGCDPRSRLTKVDSLYPVLYCRFCERYWQRDVNAARQILFNHRNIGKIFLYLRDRGRRQVIYGRPADGEEFNPPIRRNPPAGVVPVDVDSEDEPSDDDIVDIQLDHELQMDLIQYFLFHTRLPVPMLGFENVHEDTSTDDSHSSHFLNPNDFYEDDDMELDDSYDENSI